MDKKTKVHMICVITIAIISQLLRFFVFRQMEGAIGWILYIVSIVVLAAMAALCASVMIKKMEQEKK